MYFSGSYRVLDWRDAQTTFTLIATHNHSYHKLVCRDDQDVKSDTMNTDDKKRSSRCLSSTSEAFESESVLILVNRPSEWKG